MEAVLTVGQQVLILFILVGVGFVLSRAKLMDEATCHGLSQLIIYVVTPCMMVVAFQRPLESSSLHGFALALALSIGVHFVAVVLSALLLGGQDTRSAMLRFSVVHSNCGYMGYPLQTALLGPIGAFYGSAYVVAFNLFAWTYGYQMLAGGRRKFSVKTALLNPGIIGIALAMALYLLQISLPQLLLTPVTYLSQLNTPLPMLVVGYQLAHADLRSALRGGKVWLAAALRLVVLPAVTLGLLLLFRVEHTVAVATAAAVAAPCAALLSIFAAEFGHDTGLSSGLVAAETVLSALTMPVMVGLAMALC